MKISWVVNTLGNIYTSLWNKDLYAELVKPTFW